MCSKRSIDLPMEYVFGGLHEVFGDVILRAHPVNLTHSGKQRGRESSIRLGQHSPFGAGVRKGKRETNRSMDWDQVKIMHFKFGDKRQKVR